MVVPGNGAEIRAWKPGIAGIREVFHARFIDHAYPPHTHDTWTLFIVDDGAIRYDLHRSHRGADRSMVSVLPPHVVHDGRPASSSGFRKRVLYLEPDALGERFIGPAVDRPVVPVDGLRARLSRLHATLECPDDRLEAETRFAFIVDEIRASFGAAQETPLAKSGDLAEQLRTLLDTHLFDAVSIAAAAATIGAPTTQVAKSFAATFGIPPHAYVLGRRLEAARDRILGGQALADVAAETGFHDQAHLTRQFRRFLGTTPGRFRGAGLD